MRAGGAGPESSRGDGPGESCRAAGRSGTPGETQLVAFLRKEKPRLEDARVDFRPSPPAAKRGPMEMLNQHKSLMASVSGAKSRPDPYALNSKSGWHSILAHEARRSFFPAAARPDFIGCTAGHSSRHSLGRENGKGASQHRYGRAFGSCRSRVRSCFTLPRAGLSGAVALGSHFRRFGLSGTSTPKRFESCPAYKKRAGL